MGRNLAAPNENAAPTLRDQYQYAKLAADADVIPYQYQKKPGDILVAVNYGASMGLSFSESLYRLNVIQGKPTMSAELVAAQVRKAGHKLRIYKDEANLSARATINRADDPDFEFSVTRDANWAHSMGLDKPDKKGNPSNYIKQPMTMLVWRAITAVAREACPEALFGAGYTPDELADEDVDNSAAPSQESPVSAVVVPTPKQRKELHDLLSKCGVKTKKQARTVISALADVDSDNVADIPDDTVLLLLENKSAVPARIQQLLAKKPQTEPAAAPPVDVAPAVSASVGGVDGTQ